MIFLTQIGIALLLLMNGSTRNVSADEIKQVIEHFVYARLDSTKEGIAIEYRSLPARVMNVPLRAQLRVVPGPSAALHNNVMLPVEVFWDNRVEHTFIVSVRIRTHRPALIASQDVEKHETGETITVSMETIETTMLQENVISDRTSLSGKRTKRNIRKGTVLTAGMFEPVPVISQGDVVTLLVKANNVIIKTRAIAREDGASGEVVSVQKEGTRERLRARILDRSTVELIAQK